MLRSRFLPAALVLAAGLACLGPPQKPCPACDTPNPATLTGIWYDRAVAEAWQSGRSDRLAELQMGESCPHIAFPEPGRMLDVRAWDRTECGLAARAEGDHWVLQLQCDVNPGIANQWTWTGADTATLRFAGQQRELVKLDVAPADILAIWSALQPIDTDADDEGDDGDAEDEPAEGAAPPTEPPPRPRPRPAPAPEDDYVGPSKVHRRQK